MLVHHFLDYYARNTPDLPCLTQDGVTTSYGDIAARSRHLANGLLALGVARGQRIAILGENSSEHLVMLVAASRIGAVLVSLNYRLAPAELAYIIEDAGTRVLLALDGTISRAEAARNPAPPVGVHPGPRRDIGDAVITG